MIRSSSFLFRELDFQPYDLIPDIDDDWEDPSKEDWQPAGGRRVRRVSLTSWKPAVPSPGLTNSQSMYNPEGKPFSYCF